MVETILDDGGSFAVRVRVTSSREQSSSWASQVFYVDMLPPARAVLRPQYDPETGVMVLEVEPHEPRYGVENARNLHAAPQGDEVTYARGSNGEYIIEYLTNQGDGPLPEITSYNRSNVTTPAPSGSGGWQGHTGDHQQRINAPAGSWVAMSYYVRYIGELESTYYRPRIYIRDENSATIDSYDGTGNVYHNEGEWTKVTNVIEAPDGAAYAGFWHYFIGGDNTEAGDTIDLAGLQYAYASTRAAALEAVEHYFDGSMSADDDYAYRWAGAPHDSPSIRYELIDEAVEGTEPFEATIDNFSIQRRVNDGEWVTIIDRVDALRVYEEEGDEGARIISLMDLLPAINGRNEYRLHLRSVAPSVADTDPVRVAVTPADNEGWTFLNYGPDMGSVLRVGNNVEVGEGIELEGTDVPIAGRRRPLSLFGEHETRTLSISGQLYHDELHTAPSSQSPLDSPPDDWRNAQREANTVCLRTPAGHRIYGRMTGLDLTTSNLNVTRLSFSVVENDFREEESTGAGVEVGH